MRKILENTKTIIAEMTGAVGGFLWGKATNWDYEPLILLTISSLGFLVSLFLLFWKKETNENLSITTNHNNEIISHIYSKETPKTIKNKIDESPLFQKDDIAKHYVGLLVRWNLRLFLIHKGKSSQITVSMRLGDSLFPGIEFDTNTDLYPVFKTAEKDKEFIVTGKIIDCSEHDIKLDLMELKEA